jgi:hypothetical protein
MPTTRVGRSRREWVGGGRAAGGDAPARDACQVHQINYALFQHGQNTALLPHEGQGTKITINVCSTSLSRRERRRQRDGEAAFFATCMCSTSPFAIYNSALRVISQALCFDLLCQVQVLLLFGQVVKFLCRRSYAVMKIVF